LSLPLAYSRDAGERQRASRCAGERARARVDRWPPSTARVCRRSDARTAVVADAGRRSLRPSDTEKGL